MSRPTIPLQRVKDHLRIQHALDDDLIAALTEAAIDRTLAEVGLAGEFEASPRETVLTGERTRLPLPCVAVSGVTFDGTAVDADWWTLEGNADIGQDVVLSEEALENYGEFIATWEPGWAEVPAWFLVACLFLVANYYENRGSVVVGQGIGAVELPMGFKHLCRPHKRVFFA